MTGGVVLPGNTYGEDSFEGQELAIGIASFTTHHPLEPSCLNTHTLTKAAEGSGSHADTVKRADLRSSR